MNKYLYILEDDELSKNDNNNKNQASHVEDKKIIKMMLKK